MKLAYFTAGAAFIVMMFALGWQVDRILIWFFTVALY
jgi:hypothetical protein